MSPPPPPRAHPRAAKVLLGRTLTVRRAVEILVAVTFSVTLVGGVLIHFADRKNFPGIGGGVWWSVQTVTTVGYGDLVPTTVTGRVIAGLVMLCGIGFITVMTAAITSTFIETARRRLQGDRDAALTATLDHIATRLDAIETSLTELERASPAPPRDQRGR
jgi:voltage-gated potassium channel